MATSNLQRHMSKLLSVHFGEFTIRENIRPYWLVNDDGARLELDFYIEELDTAIEVQGNQHFEYTPFFHSDPGGFERQLQRDLMKRRICIQLGIWLIEVKDETTAWQAVLAIKGHEEAPRPVNILATDEQVSEFDRLFDKLALAASEGRRPGGTAVGSLLGGLNKIIEQTGGDIFWTFNQARAQEIKTLLRELHVTRAWNRYVGKSHLYRVRPVAAGKWHLSPLKPGPSHATVTRTGDDFTCTCQEYAQKGICPHVVRFLQKRVATAECELQAIADTTPLKTQF